MTAPFRRRALLSFPRLAGPLVTAALAALLATTAARPALAGAEEWSTFDVEAQEQDDESVLDHVLTRTPRDWRDDWEHATRAIRTSQGCLTAGQWFDRTDLKLAAPIARHAEFGLLLRQIEDDAQSFRYLDFQFRFPAPWGTPGFWFRPFYDKSRQDFSFTWDVGADTTAEQLQLAFTLEDVFNNLWAFRQTRVGGLAEPYQRRPYEPSLRWVSRHDRVRAELAGRWLTPSRKRVLDFAAAEPARVVSLWGSLAEASVEARALGLEWTVAATNQQAFGTDAPEDGSTADNANFRRRWSVEGGVARRVTPSLTTRLDYLYQDRDARRGPPLGPATFRGIDRLVAGEARWTVRPGWVARGGAMYDRIGIAETGGPHGPTHGSRKESRAFLGLEVTLGHVTLSGVEGIELDHEPYEVWFVHDKGFLSLQATF